MIVPAMLGPDFLNTWADDDFFSGCVSLDIFCVFT